MSRKDNKKVDTTLQRLKSIQGIERHLGKLLESMDELKSVNQEGLQQFENERAAAKVALDADLLRMDSERRTKMLDLELELKAAQRNNALQILEKTGEEAILVSKREALEKRVHDLEQELVKVSAEVESRTKKSLEAKHAMDLERTKLTHEKENAALTEHNKAIESQLAQKDRIIAEMRQDIVQMRELVQGVAEASNRPVYMPTPSK